MQVATTPMARAVLRCNLRASPLRLLLAFSPPFLRLLVKYIPRCSRWRSRPLARAPPGLCLSPALTNLNPTIAESLADSPTHGPPRHDGGPDPQETRKHVARGPMDAGRRIRARWRLQIPR